MVWFTKQKHSQVTVIEDTVVGGYPKGEIPPRFTTKPIKKRRILPPLSTEPLYLFFEGDYASTLLIGADESLVFNDKHPDVLIAYTKEQGRLYIIGMVDSDVAWPEALSLPLGEWKSLFRGQFEKLRLWDQWFRRI